MTGITREESEKCLNELKSSSFKVDEGSVAAQYAVWAATYDSDSMKDLKFTSPIVSADELVKVAMNNKEFTVLDVGCGTGLVPSLCKERGLTECKWWGFDLTKEMLDALAAKMKEPEGPKYERVDQHDLSVLPWPYEDNSVDACVCNGVLIYVSDPANLDEFVRVTKPGGHCVIMFRHDGYTEAYKAKDAALRAAGKWELISKTDDRVNFEALKDTNPIYFNIWTYKVLA
mmetsp:Transcript_12277/g.44766  ORF Transcript_12277/g.44766 Transcript_12277/m.44766 type:complete len:230 (-) Transcript_12277:1606-2295(-)